jgi:hypothetical protein
VNSVLRLTPEQHKAFIRLQNTGVMEYFQLALANCQDQLVTQQDELLLRQLQGQAQAYRHLLQLIQSTGQPGR